MRHATPAPQPAPEAQRARRLAAAYAGLVMGTTGLIVLGALVRAHGAGLACPDWPLCFGEVVPRMNLEVAFEWGHRVTAGTISLVLAALAVATLRSPDLRPGALPYVVVAAALLALQVLLGALTVWHLLAAWTVTSHLVVGNAFNVTLFLLALHLRGRAAGAEGAGSVAAGSAARAGPGTRGVVVAAALFLLFQIVMGGLVSSRYAGMACPEFPTCNGGEWFPAWSGAVGLHVHHRVNAVLLLGLLTAAAVVARANPRVARLALAALALAVAQGAVGVANVLLGIPVEVTGLHSLGAALLILTTAALVRAAFLPVDA